MNTKMCPRCKETKDKTLFYKDKKRKDGLCYYCKICQAKLNKESLDKHNARDYTLRREYGIGIKDYEMMHEKQAGVCLICSRDSQGKRLHVDHCHSTGIIRGLLCGTCNRGLGYAKDNPEILRQVIQYLRNCIQSFNSAK